MKEELNDIVIGEIAAVEKLIKALEEQHSNILNGSAIEMESSVKEIEECNKKIAEWEVKRRQITGGEPMSKLVADAKYSELDDNYRKMKKLLNAAILQKDTNEILIKQGLGFTTRVLKILNPDRTAKTYNSYGKVAR